MFVFLCSIFINVGVTVCDIEESLDWVWEQYSSDLRFLWLKLIGISRKLHDV
jgi:hypothetical protein